MALVCRSFWLRWWVGRLEVGLGRVVGEQVLMERAREGEHDGPGVMLSLGVSTGWGQAGSYFFTNYEGLYVCVCVCVCVYGCTNQAFTQS